MNNRGIFGMKKWICCLLMAVLAVGMLTACGGAEEKETTAPAVSDAAPAEDEQKEAQEETAPEAPAEPETAPADEPEQPAEAQPQVTEQPKPAETPAAPAKTEAPAQAAAVTSKPAEQPAKPAEQTKAEPAPAPEPAKPAASRDTAAGYIGQSVSSLISAIGSPGSSSYAPSCMGDGEDGELHYSGFTVYTYREGGSETVQDVE